MGVAVQSAVVRTVVDGRADRAGGRARTRPHAVAHRRSPERRCISSTPTSSPRARRRCPLRPICLDWMDAQSALLSLSAVTVAEIEDGIAKLRREGATRKSANLTAWLETVLHLYGDRILPPRYADGADCRCPVGPGARTRPCAGIGRLRHCRDGATPWAYNPARNVRHFAPLGVPALDPFAALPPA